MGPRVMRAVWARTGGFGPPPHPYITPDGTLWSGCSTLAQQHASTGATHWCHPHTTVVSYPHHAGVTPPAAVLAAGVNPAVLLLLPLRRFHFSSLALADSKLISALITIPVPAAFSTYLPALLAASLAFVVLQSLLVCALYAWRSSQQYKADTQDPRLDDSPTAPALRRRKPLAVASGVLTALQYGLTLWFLFMVAITFLWYGGGMVAAKATTDAVATMSVVDETMPRLIQNAMGIDPRKQVGGRWVRVLVRRVWGGAEGGRGGETVVS